MSRLPVVSGAQCVKALERGGFRIRRQTGSHIIMKRDTPFAQVVVPNHKVLDRGTLRGILRHADVETEEFARLL